MRTFIWAADYIDFTAEELFVAQADNLDDARQLVKNQLQCTLDSYINELNKQKSNGIIDSADYERLLEIKKRDFANVMALIYKHKPSHVISAGMAIRIKHSNL